MIARKTLGIIPRLLVALAVAFAPLAALAQAPAIQTAAVLSKKSTAALDLNFQTNSAVYRGANVGRIAAVPGWTFTRPGTNLLTYSAAFDNAAWIKDTGVTVTPASAVAPDGTLTASTVDYVGTAKSLYRSQTIATAGQTYTASIYLRANAAGTLRLAGAAGTGATTLNITTSWQRFTTTFVAAGASDVLQLTRVTSGDLTQVYVANAQFEPGSVAYTYQPTTTASQVFAPLTYAETRGGQLLTFGANEPRVTDKGLLVEEAGSNLLLRSQEFDNAAWTRPNSTVTADAAIAPDGTLTADLLTATTAFSSVNTTAAVVVTPSTSYTPFRSRQSFVGANVIQLGRRGGQLF
jgi:hypothetical protein